MNASKDCYNLPLNLPLTIPHTFGNQDGVQLGAPDLVIEIASPGTAAYDRLSKFQAYAQAGVKEYWIVNPERHSIEVAFLQDGGYVLQGVFHGSDTLPSRIVPGITSVNVEQFFL